MKKQLVLIALLSATIFSYAGNSSYTIGARASALGGASVALGDVWSANNNQAGLAFVEGVSAGTFFENRFLLKELSLKSLAVAVPVGKGSFGVSVNSFGFNLYNENKFGLGYGMALTKNFAVGVQIDYLQNNITAETIQTTDGALTAELGVIAKFENGLSGGFHIFNPIGARFMDSNNDVPTIFRIGLAHQFSKEVLASVEVEKDIDFEEAVKIGLEYLITEKIYIRGGISTNPFLSSLGVGYQSDRLKIDFASSVHTVLGYTPHISLSYQFNK